MKSQKASTKKWIYLLLAFLIPFVSILMVMIVSGSAPFGKSSFLYSDMYHQYYPFFVEYRNAILSGKSLIYTWNVGMGMDYLGLISYYLSSPLYLLSIFVPEGWLLGYFSLLLPVKLGLAGLFFAIFLKKTFRKEDLALPLFASFYALCAWALGYLWNIMWLDTFALLPLVVLGTISLLEKRRFALYTVTLFFSILANYYIGFFTCIFILLVFICYEICCWKGFVKLLKDLLLMALFSALAIGMTAFLELPAYTALQTTQSSVNEFPKGFQLNIVDTNTLKGLFDAMRQVAGNLNGGLAPTFKEGLPNIYCGIGTIMLAFLFLTSREIKISDKVCSVVLVLFVMVSYIIRQLDYMWHGFHFTNMIPYRFSFLQCFLMLVMAYRAYLCRSSFRQWQVIIASVVSVGILLCSAEAENFHFTIYNILLIFIYFLVLLVSTKTMVVVDPQTQIAETVPYHKPRHISLLLCGVLVAEIIFNVVNFGYNFGGADISNYPKNDKETSAVVAKMQELANDESFYRAEVTHSQTLNDAALNGYNGISTFTSSANANVTQFMQQLGYGARKTYNRYCYEECSPVANLFLNLKYMIERDGNVEDNTYFDNIYHSGDVYLLENNAYLPLGFLTEGEIISVDFAEDLSPFLFQNRLFSAATGIESSVWKFETGTDLTISANTQNLTSMPLAGYCTYDLRGHPKDTIVYQYKMTQSGFACFYLHQSKRNSVSIWKNGEHLYSETYSIPQMYSVADVQPGDIIEVRLKCAAGDAGAISIHMASVDENVFRQGHAILSESVLEIDKFKDTEITGRISCNRSGVLYTSIPQNGNWIVFVDGEPASTVNIGNTMVGVMLAKGDHTITFQYRNISLYIGSAISIVCLIVFALTTFFIYRDKNHRIKGKYE